MKASEAGQYHPLVGIGVTNPHAVEIHISEYLLPVNDVIKIPNVRYELIDAKGMDAL